jgi:hypothetical protein
LHGRNHDTANRCNNGTEAQQAIQMCVHGFLLFYLPPGVWIPKKTGPHYTPISKSSQRRQDAACASTRAAENDSFANDVSLFGCFMRGTAPPGCRLLAAGWPGEVFFLKKVLKYNAFSSE